MKSLWSIIVIARYPLILGGFFILSSIGFNINNPYPNINGYVGNQQNFTNLVLEAFNNIPNYDYNQMTQIVNTLITRKINTNLMNSVSTLGVAGGIILSLSIFIYGLLRAGHNPFIINNLWNLLNFIMNVRIHPNLIVGFVIISNLMIILLSYVWKD